ncbi:universal stress protein [Paractinoplanes maris]|uniref:universal stress protein n=1 Tax=Paractinoplanes maris TaxID=1734446 RepID=UPI0034DB6292
MSDERGKVVVGISSSLAGLEALRFAIAEARRRQATLMAVRAWSCNNSGRARSLWEWERTARAGGSKVTRRMLREAITSLEKSPSRIDR